MVKKVGRYLESEALLIEQAAGLLGISFTKFMRQAARFWACRTIKRAAEIRREIEAEPTGGDSPTPGE